VPAVALLNRLRLCPPRGGRKQSICRRARPPSNTEEILLICRVRAADTRN